LSQSSSSENPVLDKPVLVDFSQIAREIKIAPEIVEGTVRLLDEGNTIPFITRFRKDQTGGLNEKQILEIKRVVGQHRALAERKTFILKAVEAHGGLTDELRNRIHQAPNSRALEDLYLPFKPQKQSRALVAKQQGLEPLVEEILNATSADVDLASRATHFVRVDKGLNSVEDVIRGVTDLLVERFSANSALKNELRQVLKKTGAITSKAVGEPVPEATSAGTQEAKPLDPAAEPSKEPFESGQSTISDEATPDPVVAPPPSTTPESAAAEAGVENEMVAESSVENSLSPSAETEIAEMTTADADSVDSSPVLEPSTELTAEKGENVASENSVPVPQGEPVATDTRKPKKRKKKKAAPDPFKDYHSFKQPLKNLSHHQYLAMCRGERADKLKIKVQGDEQQLEEATFKALVPAEHAFTEFLKKCAGDTLTKVLLPSVEREIRRELTENAEKQATEVFASNLRNLLHQPPLRNSRVLAIDPGFRSGCGVAILDAYGNLIEHGQIYVVGNPTKRDESKFKIADWVARLNVDVIAIGTGAACRQAEQLISDLIGEQLAESQVRYVMVNEAGASVYSISEIGREELPDLSPAIRSAVSIGRRLQDPLSEFVKISPPNIGVGMYQHDVKAKHLVDSLEDIVASCVNQVGVNVNTASVSLLRYVSGLNALTARRLVEHRQKIGGFKNRQQLKDVAGIGDATFIQAAGFLRIHDGDQPLDSTSIHPESYPLAENILARAKTSLEELFPRTPSPSRAQIHPDPPAQTVDNVDTAVVTTEPESDSSDTAENREAAEAQLGENLESESSAADSSETTQSENVPFTSHSEHSELSAEFSEKMEARKKALQRLSELNIATIAAENNAGRLLVRDILLALKKPTYDPRDRVAKPIFRRGILKIDDLKPEMQLEGQVVNVVDFGVFVDIGLGESSLVHVSQLSHRYVADPHRFYSVGDVIKVWVSEIDSARRRVKLTAIQPGSKPMPKRHSDSDHNRPATSSESKFNKRSETDSAKKSKPGRFGSSVPRNSRKESGAAASSESQTPRFDRQSSKPRFESNRDRFRDENSRRQKRSPRSQQPAPPITDEMLKGSEPMRSFSDLLQFVKQKPPKDEEKA
jgi:protein Tex